MDRCSGSRFEGSCDPARSEFVLQAGQVDPFPAVNAAVGIDLQIGQEIVLTVANENGPGEAIDPLTVDLALNSEIWHAAHPKDRRVGIRRGISAAPA